LPLIARLLLADYLCGGGAAAFFAQGAQITPHYRFDRAPARALKLIANKNCAHRQRD